MEFDTRKIDIATNLLNRIIERIKSRETIVDKLGDNVQFSVTCYKNGRENGFSIRRLGLNSDYNTSITFAECRNSDKIVVYYNISIHNDMPSNEDAEKHFSDIEKCITHCFLHLVTKE